MQVAIFQMADLFFFITSETCGPFVAQSHQSWFTAQLSRYLTAVPMTTGSNPGNVKFLVCHPLGLPNPGERLGFNLVHKKCSPQIYKRGGGSGWVKSRVGGSKVGWVGLVQNTPTPLTTDAWCGQSCRLVLYDSERYVVC